VSITTANTIYIAKSEDYLDIAEGWSTTATGFCFTDTYQAVTRQPLPRLCQMYKDHPIMEFMTNYMLTLDEQHDEQTEDLRKCITRAAGSRETAITTTMKTTED